MAGHLAPVDDALESHAHLLLPYQTEDLFRHLSESDRRFRAFAVPEKDLTEEGLEDPPGEEIGSDADSFAVEDLVARAA